jgi:TRAP-type C4-dicarboxylate transport system substrate-binding protein
MPTRRRGIVLAAGLVLLAMVSTSCRGSGVDKVGGRTGKVRVLTLATHEEEGENGDLDFAAAVRRLSQGSMRIDVRRGWRAGDAEHERDTIGDVRTGSVDLAVVGVRSFDEVGVRSFQALLAPFLVDSTGLERRVLESPIADRMLSGVERIGLVGISLVPGAMRLPLGVTRVLLRPDDYRGARIGVRPGGVAAATFRALGARPVPYVEGSVAGLDGAELDVWTIGSNSYDTKARALTTNVVLWPRTQAIVIRRSLFDGLTPAQRAILREAGRATIAPLQARLQRLAAPALAAICRDRTTRLVRATASDLAALRTAVRPVYAQLERTAATKRFISQIAAMRDSAVPAAPPSCPSASGRSATQGSSSIEGRWTWVWTRKELIRGGVDPDTAAALAGRGSVAFRDGRFRTPSGVNGAFRVDGDLITMVFAAPAPPGTVAGVTYVMRWSVYRNLLTFSAAPGRASLDAMLIKPFRRAG